MRASPVSYTHLVALNKEVARRPTIEKVRNAVHVFGSSCVETEITGHVDAMELSSEFNCMVAPNLCHVVAESVRGSVLTVRLATGYPAQCSNCLLYTSRCV